MTNCYALQTVQAFGTSSNGLGVKGLAFAGSDPYIAETAAVTVIGPAGGIAVASNIPATAPTAITSDRNVVFVADTPMPAGVSNILRLNTSTNFRDLYSNTGALPDGTIKPFKFVSGLSLDTVTTRLFVADDPANGVQVLQGHIWTVPDALEQYCENPVGRDLPCRGSKIP